MAGPIGRELLTALGAVWTRAEALAALCLAAEAERGVMARTAARLGISERSLYRLQVEDAAVAQILHVATRGRGLKTQRVDAALRRGA